MSEDVFDIISKKIADGEPSPFTRGDIYKWMARAAEAARKPHQTPEAAFLEYATQTDAGRTMYEAYKRSPGPDHGGVDREADAHEPESSPALKALDDKASALAKSDSTLTQAQAFEKVYTNPANRELVNRYKRERRAA
jgi:hypothetical protein